MELVLGRPHLAPSFNGPFEILGKCNFFSLQGARRKVGVVGVKVGLITNDQKVIISNTFFGYVIFENFLRTVFKNVRIWQWQDPKNVCVGQSQFPKNACLHPFAPLLNSAFIVFITPRLPVYCSLRTAGLNPVSADRNFVGGRYRKFSNFSPPPPKQG